jgi:hypothetical protein
MKVASILRASLGVAGLDAGTLVAVRIAVESEVEKNEPAAHICCFGSSSDYGI